MGANYKTEAVAQLAAEIKGAGFRVFLAEKGTYGFFTDAEGTRVVCFQFDLGGFKYSGNYVTSAPRQTGTGWQLADDSFTGLFNQSAPSWATGGHEWRYTTLAQHLATYQWSSRYVEVTQ